MSFFLASESKFGHEEATHGLRVIKKIPMRIWLEERKKERRTDICPHHVGIGRIVICVQEVVKREERI
jgi:hypothetical protein